ncbi:hypothetical protein CXF68_00975 [Tenacibaculum sp. Bg11-29]|uniref:hypothetical protein n=1 Tax=Tenacibaculum sp. Bg11-29 TaxID=2058306 RepID=UPI000C33FE67|nr:hypothetical protein [Tenacibaculum sp. Bg11-29]PKH49345.1 hypothetical protein CXF68_00975 [Tenacibaculum sp. Bg11-29]
MQKCKLCLTKNADKKNSHIIPKFMGKRLFESTNPRYGVKIDVNGKSKKIQDSPKEDYIFCSDCEERFAKLEHYFSLKLKSIHNYSNEKDKFKIHTIQKNTILECFKVPFNAIKLFNYSLVWRASISNRHEFSNFKLPKLNEEILRTFLNSNLTLSHKKLTETLKNIQDETNFDSYFFKCIVKNEYSRGIFTAYEFSKHSFGLFLVDIIIFLYIDKSKIPNEFQIISNTQKNNALIAMADIPNWKKLNSGPLKSISNVIN